ncbi:MAG TPA: DUF1302 family protein [Chitinophagaceae bacterium]|nr:DUF1302 family protein [Chitinophagaceae bacterium]
MATQFLNRIILILLLETSFFSLRAQDSIQVKKQDSKWQVSGYITDMQVVSFQKIDSMTATNLIHNRIDIQYFPNDHLTFHAGVRNRIFFGNPVFNLPGFGNQIDAYYKNDLIQLSKFWVNRNSLIINSVVDRLWADWNEGKWDIRLGKQRINWGKTLVWNPNDWFNTFNYADFDYPERPGSDALRISYYPSGMSVIDLAVSPGRYKSESVSAIRFGLNKWDYDFQFLGGIYHQDAALGVGWSGNIGGLGFRGEGSWFKPYQNFPDSSGKVSATISMDYRAPDTWYFQGAVLYNSVDHAPQNVEALIEAFTGNLSAKQLMPSEWSFFGEISRDITPLLHADLSVISGLDPALVFIMPSISYSVTENFQVTGTGQAFLGKMSNQIEDVGNGVYFRFKYNF